MRLLYDTIFYLCVVEQFFFRMADLTSSKITVADVIKKLEVDETVATSYQIDFLKQVYNDKFAEQKKTNTGNSPLGLIIADDMGLGKSREILLLILTEVATNFNIPKEMNYSIIVCSKSIIPVWVKKESTVFYQSVITDILESAGKRIKIIACDSKSTIKADEDETLHTIFVISKDSTKIKTSAKSWTPHIVVGDEIHTYGMGNKFGGKDQLHQINSIQANIRIGATGTLFVSSFIDMAVVTVFVSGQNTSLDDFLKTLVANTKKFTDKEFTDTIKPDLMRFKDMQTRRTTIQDFVIKIAAPLRAIIKKYLIRRTKARTFKRIGFDAPTKNSSSAMPYKHDILFLVPLEPDDISCGNIIKHMADAYDACEFIYNQRLGTDTLTTTDFKKFDAIFKGFPQNLDWLAIRHNYTKSLQKTLETIQETITKVPGFMNRKAGSKVLVQDVTEDTKTVAHDALRHESYNTVNDFKSIQPINNRSDDAFKSFYLSRAAETDIATLFKPPAKYTSFDNVVPNKVPHNKDTAFAKTLLKLFEIIYSGATKTTTTRKQRQVRPKIAIFYSHNVVKNGIISILKDKYRSPESLKFDSLDGNTKDSNAVLQKFDGDGTDVLLCNFAVGATGISFKSCQHIIIAESFWTFAESAQASDRHYRKGFKHDCFVYRIVLTDNHLDSRMYVIMIPSFLTLIINLKILGSLFTLITIPILILFGSLFFCRHRYYTSVARQIYANACLEDIPFNDTTYLKDIHGLHGNASALGPSHSVTAKHAIAHEHIVNEISKRVGDPQTINENLRRHAVSFKKTQEEIDRIKSALNNPNISILPHLDQETLYLYANVAPPPPIVPTVSDTSKLNPPPQPPVPLEKQDPKNKPKFGPCLQRIAEKYKKQDGSYYSLAELTKMIQYGSIPMELHRNRKATTATSSTIKS